MHYQNDLLSCKQKEDFWLDKFVEGCFNDTIRFEKRVKRRKVRNFAPTAVKSKVRSRITRDPFGRLLYLSTVEN